MAFTYMIPDQAADGGQRKVSKAEYKVWEEGERKRILFERKKDREEEKAIALQKRIDDGRMPTLSSTLQKIMGQITKGHSEPTLVNIIRKQIQKAEAGDTKAAGFLFDRAFGMPKQTIETLGEVPNKLRIEIVQALGPSPSFKEKLSIDVLSLNEKSNGKEKSSREKRSHDEVNHGESTGA